MMLGAAIALAVVAAGEFYFGIGIAAGDKGDSLATLRANEKTAKPLFYSALVWLVVSLVCFAWVGVTAIVG